MNYVFYAGLLYGEYGYNYGEWRFNLPEGAYIYYSKLKCWQRTNTFGIIEESEVPKELVLQVMLLS